MAPVLAVVVLAALAALAAGCGSSGNGGDKPAAAKAQTISFQKPEDPGPEPFTAASDVTGSKTVSVQASGPYGGSGSDKVCDRDLLIKYLKANPDRMRAWARVVGIDPDFRTVSRYIAKLHPVTLTRDTQVTNHSFVNGQAVGFQSILQAGTAVLVDKYGRPVARCRCGNPLKEPIFYKTYTCKDCPPNYRPPKQCDYYGGTTDYDKDYYSGDYYSNDEYDATFVDSSKSSKYGKCYEAYPDPPKVTSVTLYKPPAQQTAPYETTSQPYHQKYSGPDCNNPRSQLEYEQCHPPDSGYPGTTTDQYPPPDHQPPPNEPSYP